MVRKSIQSMKTKALNPEKNKANLTQK